MRITRLGLLALACAWMGCDEPLDSGRDGEDAGTCDDCEDADAGTCVPGATPPETEMRGCGPTDAGTQSRRRACTLDGGWGDWTDWDDCSSMCTEAETQMCTAMGASCCPSATGAAATCAMLMVDEANCGVCGRACPAGQFCTFSPTLGESFCSPCNPDACGAFGVICCPGSSDQCTPQITDANNCGGCGVRCGAGRTCANGMCQ